MHLNQINGIRIDPADEDGIHIVQVGGERIYVKFKRIPTLIDILQEVIDRRDRNKQEQERKDI